MRSLLFVPADGGKKLDKAMVSGAHAVIIDLEDSVATERRGVAMWPAFRDPALVRLKRHATRSPFDRDRTTS